tara:strand:+ start:21287 stop:21655 length:369 start_codon:yes stop_codon:yes gene_type:complete
MSWVIIKQPHPLDAIWSQAVEAYSDAEHALDNLQSPFTDEENNALVAAVGDAVQVIMALPARNLSDSLFKLDIAGVENADGIRFDCDAAAIMSEARALLEKAMGRGARLARDIPDMLEGVQL